MHRTFPLVCAAAGLLTLAGCVPTLAEARPDEPPAADEMVIVGEVAFEPAITPAHSAHGTFDPFDTLSKVVLAFTDRPETPVDLTQTHATADHYAAFELGEPFAFVVPRRVLYLRGLRASVREASGNAGTYFGPNGAEPETAVSIEALICSGVRKIVPPKDGHYVYVGRIVCRHKPLPGASADFHADPDRVLIRAREETSWTFEDHLSALRPKLPALIGAHQPAVVLPVEVTPTAR